MSNLFHPDKKFTQSDIAKLLGISERQVRNLIQQGILPAAKGRDGMNPLACNHAYITYKSQLKSPIQEAEAEEDEDEEMAREEQRLKLEEKRENIAMKRAKRVLFEKSYAPIELIVETLQQLGGRLASRHDSLIPKMKIAYPDMPPEVREVLEAELTAAVNECADILPDLSDYMDSDPGSSPSWLVGDEENTTSYRD